MKRTLIASLLVMTTGIALGLSEAPGLAVDAAARQLLDDGTLQGDVAEAVRRAL